MPQLLKTRVGRLSALVFSGILGLAMIMMAGSFASTAQATSSATASVAALDPGQVASTPAGTMTAPINGMTADQDAVTGTFTPMRFIKRDGRVWARGIISGVITDSADASTRTFTVIRTVRVNRMNGEPVRNARALRAQCEILDLVLAPIDLNLLGLVVHLDRVHLNITAVSGPGNLLGNLLCAVAGLLDGGLQGLLGQLTTLLNQILAQLGLGL
jgi:hypothetical protein